MLDKYPVRVADIAYRLIDGEAILVSAKQGQLYTLNSVGARIWELADGQTSLSDIIDDICATYEAAKERAYSDSVEFLQDLADRGMLEIRSNPGVAA